mmetsp:Transcript_8205/g.11927  ORF Transcript_8205/g.11927 Transcript_8205/m.11927 type:complete len:125 (+) Transcript_8205:208-582(+)
MLDMSRSSCHQQLDDTIIMPSTDTSSVNSDGSEARRSVHFGINLVSNVWETPYINEKDKENLFYNKAELRKFRMEAKESSSHDITPRSLRLHPRRHSTPPAPFRPPKKQITPETMVMIDTMYLF